MKLRQVALAAQQLEPNRQVLFDLLGIDYDYADPGVGEFGLENSVMAIGDTFLEIVAPTAPNTAAGRMLEKRQTTCGYMVLMQVDDYASYVTHLQNCAVRTIWNVDRPQVSACHIHPKDIGGAIVSFDEMRPPESWLWAGPNWQKQRAQHVDRLLGCTLQTVDAAGLAERWSEIMQTKIQQKDDALRLEFTDGTFIEFIDANNKNHRATYEGLAGFTFATPNPQSAYDRATSLGLPMHKSRHQVMLGGLGLAFE